MNETRLTTQGDVIVGKVSKEGVAVLITSVRPPQMEPLEIQIQRLDTQTIDRNPAPAPKAIAKKGITGRSQSIEHGKLVGSKGTTIAAAGDIPLQIVAHVQNRGDVPFTDTLWGGFLGSSLAIEALSVLPAIEFDGGKIEYKTLDASGGEPPWATDGALCGSRGQALP